MGSIKLTPRIGRVAVIITVMVLAALAVACHSTSGHQENTSEGEPLFVYGPWAHLDLALKTLLGEPLTVSNFPGFGLDVGTYLSQGLSAWNTELRTAPTSFAFDVFQGVSNNNTAADVWIKVFDPALPNPPCTQSACSFTVVDDGNTSKSHANGWGTVWINKDVFPINPSNVQRSIVAHELGHVLAQ